VRGTSEKGHQAAGQRKADERDDREARHGGLVGAVAREGPAPIEAVGDRAADQETEHRRQHGIGTTRFDGGDERQVMEHGGESTHAGVADELVREPQYRRGQRARRRAHTHPPSQM